MQVAGFKGADERAVNEVRGWLYACATQSAGHLTDYVVDFGTAALFGGARTSQLIAWCEKAGLLTPRRVNGAKAWVIINDPEFIHIRTREEVEWDRQRKRDVADLGLTVPVRLRDGDNCRYCGVQVQWRGRKSNRSAELDHRVPGAAATVDTLVVACRRCNGARKANAQWDDDHPLRPAPRVARYDRVTAEFLTENGYPTTANLSPDATAAGDSGSARDHAQRPLAPGSAPDWVSSPDHASFSATAVGDSGSARDYAQRPLAPGSAPAGRGPEVGSELSRNSISDSPGMSLPGSGREEIGSVRVGSGLGRDGPGVGRRRRGRRGGRGRSTEGER
ncbi:5-methylcytosine-specific restriction endonuclease McrA [Serinibacter salmoneus]|uniref:5-methylcytosine-specific restriction endonuclease McrA n=1 Tax=Serinibacter salmoneus TaxID=556530 RepID=A0A2A9CZK3_9MICO|nr:5-methylcytosine-specific restriction endonuclease McrA [Serinibacter salmoneus]